VNGIVLIEIEALRQVFDPPIDGIVAAYREIMGSRRVLRPVVAEEESLIVVGGVEVLEALRLLSAKRAPVACVRRDEVRIWRVGPPGEEIGLDGLLREYSLRGRLPLGGFKVELLREVGPVDLGLGELGLEWVADRGRLRVYDDALSLLVESWPTPLVRLKSYSRDGRAVYAKLESFNPFSNSVKDRVGWAMMMEALERGALGDLLYEATSTNTGIALASIANILGRKTRLFIPKSIQRVSDTFLRVLGAEVVRVPVSLTIEAVGEVDEMARRDGATHLNQFENDANLRVHLKYTARELDQQLASIGVKPDYIIGGLGTSGHMSAISIYFKSKYGREVRLVGVQPARDEIIPGIRRVESGMKWVHMAEFDEIIDVKLDEAIEAAIEVARREGLLIGLSSGAVFHAFKRLAENGGNFVLIFPDSGYKYAEQFEEYFRRRGIGLG